MLRPASPLRLLASAAVAAALGGCAVGTPDATPERHGDGVVKTDLAPLTTRLPGLAAATGAHWTSGTIGDDRAPGPSTYWIDAVVDLPAATLTQLRADAGTEPADAPDVAAALRDHLPDGPFETSDDLDASLAADGWSVQAYLTGSPDQLVVRIVGGS